MTEQMTVKFMPQTSPPDDRRDPAYWFAFQDDKMLVRAGERGLEAPHVADLAELGLTADTPAVPGVSAGRQAGPIHCYSAEIDPARH